MDISVLLAFGTLVSHLGIALVFGTVLRNQIHMKQTRSVLPLIDFFSLQAFYFNFEPARETTIGSVSHESVAHSVLHEKLSIPSFYFNMYWKSLEATKNGKISSRRYSRNETINVSCCILLQCTQRYKMKWLLNYYIRLKHSIDEIVSQKLLI